jgi:hypothetical protein
MSKSLTPSDFAHAAALLGCEVAAIKAVSEVESRNSGFNPDGSPVTLFEGHKFHQFTQGRFDDTHPTLSYAEWTRIHYGRTWEDEVARLEIAITLDRRAALMSASWGKFQIMGFNHGAAGYTDLEAFVVDMCRTEREHLLAFCAFVKSQGIDDELRDHRWSDFALRYNGRSYKANRYDLKLAQAYARYVKDAAP